MKFRVKYVGILLSVALSLSANFHAVDCQDVNVRSQPRYRPRNLPQPAQNGEEVRSLSDISLVGQSNTDYNWGYELSDGTQSEQRGFLKNPFATKEQDRIQTVSGFYSYISPEGHLVNVSYTADERGFRPVILNPAVTPPPIPDEIQKSLSILRKNAEDQLKREAEKNGMDFQKSRILLYSQFPSENSNSNSDSNSEGTKAKEGDKQLNSSAPTLQIGTELQPPRLVRRKGRRRKIPGNSTTTTTISTVSLS